MNHANEIKSVLVAASLIILNIVLMPGFSQTPAVDLFQYVWQIPILGLIVYAAPLILGGYIAKKGLKENNKKLLWSGIGLLQLAYAAFGAGILGGANLASQAAILGIAAFITLGITIIAALIVYLTGKNFERAGTYSTYAFIGVFLMALIGSLTPTVLILAFGLAFTGFFLYLIYEIWSMKSYTRSPIENGLGIYIAFAGVFVHVLQIVARNYLEE